MIVATGVETIPGRTLSFHVLGLVIRQVLVTDITSGRSAKVHGLGGIREEIRFTSFDVVDERSGFVTRKENIKIVPLSPWVTRRFIALINDFK